MVEISKLKKNLQAAGRMKKYDVRRLTIDKQEDCVNKFDTARFS